MKNFTLLVFYLVTMYCSQAQEVRAKVLPIDPSTNCQIRYHYYPNLEAYFDNVTELYTYQIKGEWFSQKELPNGFRGYSMYNSANVAITDYDEEHITQFIKIHRKRYPYNTGRKTKEVVTATN